MSDLISREALLEAVDKLKVRCYVDMHGKYNPIEQAIKIINCIEDAPTIEAVPVVHGEWIHVPSSDMATGKAYKCSNCKKMRYGSFLPPFCQMCGADMRKKV